MMVKLYTRTPFSDNRDRPNLGAAYNAEMELLPEDAWACFLDHDAMFTTAVWYWDIQAAIATEPRAGLFTACTNRIGAFWQRAGDPECHDMAVHRAYGYARRAHRTLLDVTNTKGIGGVLMVLSKAAWRAAGGFVDGVSCVDHQMHFALRRKGYRIYLIEGLYLYHVRRAFDETVPADVPRVPDLPRAVCDCRGREPQPHRRIPLIERAA